MMPYILLEKRWQELQKLWQKQRGMVLSLLAELSEMALNQRGVHLQVSWGSNSKWVSECRHLFFML